MSGSFTQKSEVLRSLAMPSGLEDIHQIAITEFSSAGAVEDTLTACKARLNSAGCSSETGETSAECQVLQSECITDEVAYADAANQLKQVWLGSICPVYENYYAVYQVQFPYPKGQCRLP
jgi:hypothetical protein